jgi:hypothetical protein
LLQFVVSARHSFTFDTVSYLDSARAYLGHDWRVAVNTYFSTLYSWLLMPVVAMGRKNAAVELPAAHLLNLVLYLGALRGFGRMWRALRHSSAATDGSGVLLGEAAWLVLGYGLFALFFVFQVNALTPDLLVALVMFAAAERLLRQNESEQPFKHYVALGALLAVGYYAKAVMLVVGIAILGCTAVLTRPRSVRRLLETAAVSGFVFALLSAPLILAISAVVGHPSWSETGRANYLWWVTEYERTESIGEVNVPGIKPVLYRSPLVYASDIVPRVSYGPWYDPGRLDPRPAGFQVRAQVRALARTLSTYRYFFLTMEGGLCALIGGLLLVNFRATLRGLVRHWFLLVPALVCFMIYGLVIVEARYIAAAMVIFWGAVIGGIRIPEPSAKLANSVCVAAVVLMYAAGARFFLEPFSGLWGSGPDGATETHLAEALRKGGFGGSSVAVIGMGADCYWAHLADMHIVAEIPNAQPFTSAPAEVTADVLRALARKGAVLLVGSDANRLPTELQRRAKLVDNWYYISLGAP